MSREIKFRGWHSQLGQMLNHNWLVSAGVLYSAISNPKEGQIVMQYTGLKDKNGKEIYEGDILDASTLRTEIRGVMQWDCERGEWTKFHPLHKFEVIGNIHEHKHLLS